MSAAGGLEALISTLGATKVLAYFDLNQSYYGMVYAAILNFMTVLMDRRQLEGINFSTNGLIMLVMVGLIGIISYLFLTNRLSMAELPYLWSRLVLHFSSKNKMSIKILRKPTITRFFSYLIRGINRKDIEILDHHFGIDVLSVNDIFLSESKIYRFKDKNLDLIMTVEFISNTTKPAKNSSNAAVNLNKSDINNVPSTLSHLVGQPGFELQENGYIRYDAMSEFMNGKYITIGLNKIIDSSEFIGKFEDYYDVKDNNKTLCYVRHKNIMAIYSGNKSVFDEQNQNPSPMHNQYIKTYFHDKIDQIWKMVRRVHFEPETMTKLGQNPQLTMCLHGPPGTGKSTLAYRIAMATGRHVYNVDLKIYNKKCDFIDLIVNPNVNGISKKTKDVVFVIDEFDLTIQHLKQRQEFIEVFKMQMIEGMAIKANQFKDKVVSDDKPVKSSSLPQDTTGLGQISSMFADASSYLTINDLLEIIQGPVPYYGLIFIVTTNNLEEMYKLCPALFREGRFSPVYCGPVTAKMLHAITEFYFEVGIPSKFEVRDLKLSASSVINIALKHKFYEHSVDRFLEEVLSK